MQPTRQHGGTLLGLILGLLVGVLISFGVVWYLNRTPLPFVEKVTRPDQKSNGNGSAVPIELPGKPGDKPIDKGEERNRFDFYEILEGKKQATPTGASPLPEAASTAATAGTYLQVGAFQKRGDAENLKARLAMLGLEAGVQEAVTSDKGKLYRVRLGPFANAEEMNRARALLSDNDVPAAVVRGN